MELVLKYAPNWKAVAKDLGFSDKRVERIESDYQQSERCLHVTIWKWLHNKKRKGNDEEPSIDNLKTVWFIPLEIATILKPCSMHKRNHTLLKRQHQKFFYGVNTNSHVSKINIPQIMQRQIKITAHRD